MRSHQLAGKPALWKIVHPHNWWKISRKNSPCVAFPSSNCWPGDDCPPVWGLPSSIKFVAQIFLGKIFLVTKNVVFQDIGRGVSSWRWWEVSSVEDDIHSYRVLIYGIPLCVSDMWGTIDVFVLYSARVEIRDVTCVFLNDWRLFVGGDCGHHFHIHCIMQLGWKFVSFLKDVYQPYYIWAGWRNDMKWPSCWSTNLMENMFLYSYILYALKLPTHRSETKKKQYNG